MNLMDFINQINFNGLLWKIGGTLCFILGDVIVGFISAVIQKNVDSQKMREGLLRKMLLILIIALSFIVQYGLGITGISKVVCIYIISMEIISIAENLEKAGIDLGKIGEILKIKEEENTLNLVIKEDKSVNKDKKIKGVDKKW